MVHFEVIGKDGAKLQRYYAELFGWEIDTNNPIGYGMVSREGNVNSDGIGIGAASARAPRTSWTWSSSASSPSPKGTSSAS